MPSSPFNGISYRVRLVGAILAGGGLTVGIVVCHLATAHVPEVLNYALLVVVGWLSREAAAWEPWHGLPPTRNGPGPTHAASP
jgi:hypothetical protein